MPLCPGQELQAWVGAGPEVERPRPSAAQKALYFSDGRKWTEREGVAWGNRQQGGDRAALRGKSGLSTGHTLKMLICPNKSLSKGQGGEMRRGNQVGE